MDIVAVIVRLLLAVALGGIIGLEREFNQKPAGLRTNILICAGSAMMMTLSEILTSGAVPGSGDTLRIAAGVITGMGFIGAGTIIQARGHIHGLTTASTLWAVAGLGLVIGAGYYLIALIYTAVVVLTLAVFLRIEAAVPHLSAIHYLMRVDSLDVLDALRKEAASHRLRIENLSYRLEGGDSRVGFQVTATIARARAFREGISGLGTIVEIRVDQ